MMEDMEPLWVVGNEHHGSTFDRPGLNGTTAAAQLIREPANRFDKNAVGVHSGGVQVGHLSSARAEKIVKWIDSVGGAIDTTIAYRDGGAHVLVPAHWVAPPPKVAYVNLQQSKKYQEALAELGVGEHKCKVTADGEQLNVRVGETTVGRLYPSKLDQSTLDKIVHNRQQKLVIEDSSYTEGVFARIAIPAARALKPPAPPSQATQERVGASVAKEPTLSQSFLSRLFSRQPR